MWLLLYRFLVGPTLAAGARVASVFSPKIRRGLEGRRHQGGRLGSAAGRDLFAIHIHASSVGEFEQAKPIIEALRRDEREYRISASFFSPSGFEQQGGYREIDDAWYLPHDRPSEVARFVATVAPDLIIIIRYDLWPEFLRHASQRGIPSVLVCGTMRAGSARLKPYARGFFGWLHGQLALIDCVGEEDAVEFRRLAPHVPIEVSGDTRYDRVVERAAAGARASLPVTRRQLGEGLVVVAGSTWPADEALLASVAGLDGVRLVVVPHEPTPVHIAALRAKLPRSVLLSQVDPDAPIGEGTALIVDRTGILLKLYALADVAYVGGAFGAGVHSVLEPAAYGIPVLSGPRTERSRDATALRAAGLLEIVETGEALAASVTRHRDDAGRRRDLGGRSGAFVRERAGATARIIASLRRRGLLPSSGDAA